MPVFAWLMLISSAHLSALPVVINGECLEHFVGSPLSSLRLVNSQGHCIPFQIDELTTEGEYVCDRGEKPNSSATNGILDKQDELVFLWEDTDSVSVPPCASTVQKRPIHSELIAVIKGDNKRFVYCVNDTTIPRNQKSYIDYDHSNQFIRTPKYFAQFGKNRFHFIRAGVKNSADIGYTSLTNELRVQIVLKALWGLLPIRYSEDNIVCHVIRYKAGPLRLIRRGDFYLNLGLGIKGSQAVVFQVCYPEIVTVPVRIHLPIDFRIFFKEAYIEMTPVLRQEAASYRFEVPRMAFSRHLSDANDDDTLLRCVPDKVYRVTSGINGFGWILQSSITDQQETMEGSGYLFRKPGRGNGIAECGFRLTVRNLPIGYYAITNWVFFTDPSTYTSSHDFNSVLEPCRVSTPSCRSWNLLSTKTSRTSIKKSKR